MSLANQVILITGATSGIGEAVARQAAAQKAKLVLAARREGILQTIKDIVEKQGAEAIIVPTDMADTDQVKALADKALNQFGQVDILVNNAGFGQMGPIEEIPAEAVKYQFEVNVFGLLTLTRALIPAMRQRQQGRIINISSVAGQISMPFSGVYNASKFALEALSDALRVELTPFGIHVVVVEPGPVATDFFQIAKEKTVSFVSPEGPYRSLLEGMDEMSSSVSGFAWPVERVATVILKSMSDRKPASRYTAFTGGQFGLGLMRLLPTPLADKMWSKLFEIDQMQD